MTRLVLLAFFLLATPTVAGAQPGPGPRAGQEARPGPRDGGRMMERLREVDPERHRKVVEVATARPGLHRELLVGSGALLQIREGGAEGAARVGAIIDETYELHQRLTTFEAATGRDKERARAAVEQSVGKLFDLRQEARRAHLAALEARLERLRAEITARESQRDELVGAFTTRVTTSGGSGL